MNILGSPQIGIGVGNMNTSSSSAATGSHIGGGYQGSNFQASSYGQSHGLNSSASAAHLPSRDASMNDNAMGQQFLSSAGIDTQSLFRKARGLQMQSQTQQSQTSSSSSHPQIASSSTSNQPEPFKLHPNLYTSIDEMRSATISNILLRQRQHTEQKVQEKIQARLASHAKRIQSKSSMESIIPGTGRRVLPIASGTGTGTGGGADVDTSSYPVVDLSHDLIQNHLRLTQSQFQSQSQSGESFSLEGLEKLARTYGSQTAEYQNAIALFQTLATGAGAGSGSGFGSGGGGDKSPHGYVVSSVQYLTTLFRKFIIAQVKNHSSVQSSSSTSAFDTGAGGLLGYIYKFVEMELGRSVTLVGTSEVLWRVIYYALRCGDFECVREVLRNSPGQVDPIVVQYVEEACRLGGGVNGLDKMSDGLVSSMMELYLRVESRGNPQGQSQSSSPESSLQHELVALGLMSFSPMDNKNTLATTIEDYLWMGLWTALRQGKTDCVDTVCALADNVKHWGPQYFEDDDGTNNTESSGWAYTMPLLLCQQFRTGLGYLATKGGVGLCLAVHLGLAIHNEGVSLTDLSKTNGSASNVETALDEERFLETLVAVFVKSLQTVSPAFALDYLVHIPGSVSASLGRSASVAPTCVKMKNGKILSKNSQTQICNMILDTKAYNILCGELAGDGSRLPKGSLDKHFDKSVVSDILALSAERSVREGRVADAAELLCLAMRYSDLILLLNQQLASFLVMDGKKHPREIPKDEERSFWRGAAQQFYETYLKGGTHVIKVLEAEGNLPLGNTFQLLLNLMEFFDRCNKSNWMVRILHRVVSVEKEDINRPWLPSLRSPDCTNSFHSSCIYLNTGCI